ncbi:MAG: 4-hydroxy-tetrahydrodipicolinate synthase [Oligoflexales bacterium]|nr:4-hydroxy-tetrahydrodipicolinate synthase [Oligoflexales bacterium]
MTSNYDIKGVYTAIVTPFKNDSQIDFERFEFLIDFQLKNGVTGVVLAGSTGEGATLSNQEKISLIQHSKSVSGNRLKIMVGTGDNSTERTLELSLSAKAAGADSLLIVTPPYNRPNFQGLKKHYELISERVAIPICLYHVPGRTALILTPEQIAEICKIEYIIAVKEATGSMEFFSHAKILTNANFLSGDDSTYLPSLVVGGSGVISVISNLFPKAVMDLHNSFQKRDFDRALNVHNTLLPMIKVLFCESNPCPLKAAMYLEGMIQNELRLPLSPVSDDSFKKIASVLNNTKELLAKIGCGYE